MGTCRNDSGEVIRITTTARLQELLDSLQPQAVVFDIFDTLIHRRVHPEDVKKMAAAHLCEAVSFGGLLAWRDIYGFRRDLERTLCLESQVKGLDLEFRFAEFASRLYTLLTDRGYATFLPSASRFGELLASVELTAEKAVQYVDSRVVSAIRWLGEKGIPVFFLSDFYLPSTMLCDLLAWHGLAGCYRQVMVSSEYLETKRSGKLYQRFFNETEGLPAERLVMVGDNMEVDCRMAITAGFPATIWIDRSEIHRQYGVLTRSFADQAVIRKDLARLLERDRLFPEMAMTLYTFIRKLHGTLVGAGIGDVFFLSREGQPLKRLFDSYQRSIGASGKLVVRSHYFLASRKSTFLPSLSSCEEENFHVLFRQYRAISLRDFLVSLGLEDAVEPLAASLSVDPDFREADFPESVTFANLLGSRMFRERYEEARQERIRAFLEYLDTFSVDLSDHGLVLVDVGWKGSIQDNIYRILRRNTPGNVAVTGYYLGLLAAGDLDRDNRKQGVLFSCLGRPSPGFFVYRENTALFEVILAADHGSVARYETSRQGARPVLEDFSADAPLFHEKIQPILLDQEERFDRICELMRCHATDDTILDPFTIKQHARMVFFPRSGELNWFRSIYHLENFGLLGRTGFALDRRLTLQDRLAAMIRLFKTPRSYLENTFWPALKLKEEGLGLAIRPFNAYRRIRQLQRGEG